MTYNDVIKASEFEDLLMLFADDVAAKVYNKMPYDKWKGLLKKLDSKRFPYVEIDFGAKDVWITFIDEADTESDTDIFRKGDKSFGDFLFREYAYLLEDDTMTTSATTASATAAWASSAISDNKTHVDGLTGTVSNSWSNIDADKVAGTYDDYSTTIADAISYSYDGTSAIKNYDSYVIKSDYPQYNLTVDKDGVLKFNGKRIVCADDNDEKENNKMKNFNFDFGPCNPDTIRMSMYGLAIKNASGAWVSYNPATKQIIDVDVLNFDGAKYMYKMPVGLKEVKAGDIVIHNRKPMFVVSTAKDQSNALMVVDIYAGEEKTIVPAVNMFGFNFVTKVVSLFGELTQNAPSPDAPFGNFLPFLLMADGNDKSIDPMALMLMMGQGGGANFAQNPMMLYFLMKDGGDKDLLPLMFMMGQGNAPVANQ